MKHLLTILLVIIAFCGFTQPTVFNLPEGPYGGGLGYDEIVENPVSEGFHVVDTLPELIAAIANTSINKIYIEDGSNITVPDNQSITINRSNLVIAGGRGNKGSLAAILTKEFSSSGTQELIRITALGNNVRITGLDLVGPYNLVENHEIRGVYAEPVTNLEIDNCYFYGWSGAGIDIQGNNSSDNPAKIHHNIFENNNSEAGWDAIPGSYGYGVVVSGTRVGAKICYNTFKNNKHAIAGSSKGGESYTAMYNAVAPNMERDDHTFDMHGYYDKYGHPHIGCPDPLDSNCNYAGDSIVIEYNFFEDRTDPDQEAIQIRGIPEYGAYINDNYFSGSAGAEINQQFSPSTPEYDPSDMIRINQGNNTYNSNIKYLFSSSEGKEDWKLIAPFVWDENQLKVGDFNGDGIDDLFRSEAGKWYVSKRGSGNWELWGGSSQTASNVIIEDFNNDQLADILAYWSGAWRLATSKITGKTNGWVNYGSIGHGGTSNVITGYFNDDDLLDLMRTQEGVNGQKGYWYIAYNLGNRFDDWVEVGRSDYMLEDFGIGDFDGNGYTDLFISDGGWKIAYRSASGWGNWEPVGSSSFGPADMLFGDYDGDGDSDIFRSNGSQWFISYSNGSSKSFTGWGSPVNVSTIPFDDLFVADFIGVGHSDINSIFTRGLDFSATARKSFNDFDSDDEIFNGTTSENINMLYPNPTTGILSLYRDNIDVPVYIKVMDSSGKILIESNESTVDISQYPQGLYFVESYLGGKVSIHKVIKE